MKIVAATVLLLAFGSTEAKEGPNRNGEPAHSHEKSLASSPPPPRHLNARSVGAPAPPKARTSPAPPKARTSPAPPKARTSPVPPKARSSPAPPKARTSPAPPKARTSPAPPKARTSPAPPDARASAPDVPPKVREAPSGHHHARAKSSGHLRVKPKAEASARTRANNTRDHSEPHKKEARDQDNQYWYAGNSDYSTVVSCGACCFGTPTPLAESVFVQAGNPYKDIVEANGFYGKVIDVGGVPVIGSNAVTDAALQEQALTLVKLVVKNPSLLDDLKADTLLAAMIGKDEAITDIPAYENLNSIWPLGGGQTWDDRAGGGGIGATMLTRTVSCEEHDTLCLTTSRYPSEMICLHELAHTVGGNSVDHSRMIPFIDGVEDFKLVLDDTYQTQVVENGLYSNSIHTSDSYATTNENEYWATGVQAYYNVGRNGVNTRGELRNYDPLFYDMVHQVLDPDVSHFCPDSEGGNCDCAATRDLCQRAGVDTSGGVDSVVGGGGDGSTDGGGSGEVDTDTNCAAWASAGECTSNPGWMLPNCPVSCANAGSAAPSGSPSGSGSSSPSGSPSGSGSSSGGDTDTNCSYWASTGECENDPGWMFPNCPVSCSYLDSSEDCGDWASTGECESDPDWMFPNCPVSCSYLDSSEYCGYWASAGECTNNPGWMLPNCPVSCANLLA